MSSGGIVPKNLYLPDSDFHENFDFEGSIYQSIALTRGQVRILSLDVRAGFLFLFYNTRYYTKYILCVKMLRISKLIC